MLVITPTLTMELFKSLFLLILLLTLNSLATFEQDDNLKKEKWEKGRQKYQEIAKESSSCWVDALGVLNSSCKYMNDVEQSRLALAFANCHLERSGRQTYPCPPDSSIQECTNGDKMTDAAFQIYTEFFAHTSNMCYYLQSKVWQERTEGTIDRLSHTSYMAVEKLEEALHYQHLMEEKQTEALNNQDQIISVRITKLPNL